MIAALAFVPKGAAKQFPERDEPDAEEIEALKRDALATGALDEDGDEDDDSEEWNTDSDDEAAAVEHATGMAASMATASTGPGATASHLEAAMKRLDMDNYDNDEDTLVNRVLQGQNTEFDGEDPYITLADDDQSDGDDDVIQPTDLLVLAAKTEEDAAALEVWLFEEADEDGDRHAYVHHDIMLPAFPLSLAWCGFNHNDPDVPGNFVAVSTFDPEIEIWNLDVLDSMQPVLVLGGALEGPDGPEEPEAPDSKKKAGKKAKKSTKKSKKGLKPGSHKDSVLCLAWNATYRNVMASGSADKTVKVWDLATGTCEHTLKHHTDKVQAVAWNATEPSVLLSGGFDKRVCVCDLRTPTADAAAWDLPSDVEALAWDPHTPTRFAVAMDDGGIVLFDAAGGAGSAALFRLAAHDKAATSVCFNPAIPDLLATASTDKTVKLWDISENKPKLLCTEDLKAGAIFCIGFPADTPHVLAVGGSKGTVSLWDILHRGDIAKKYGRRFARLATGKSIKGPSKKDEDMDEDAEA